MGFKVGFFMFAFFGGYVLETIFMKAAKLKTNKEIPYKFNESPFISTILERSFSEALKMAITPNRLYIQNLDAVVTKKDKLTCSSMKRVDEQNLQSADVVTKTVLSTLVFLIKLGYNVSYEGHITNTGDMNIPFTITYNK